jgi:hypothetical protein
MPARVFAVEHWFGGSSKQLIKERYNSFDSALNKEIAADGN